MRKKRRSIAFLASVSLAAVCLFGALAGCAPVEAGPEEEPDGTVRPDEKPDEQPDEQPELTLPDWYRPESVSVFALPPQDGSTPADYTALENYAYAAGKLACSPAYHVDSLSKATAKVLILNVEQEVRGSKDFKEGVLVTSTVSTSSSALAPSKAVQKYYGEDQVIVRGPASDDAADWEGGVEWAAGEPLEVLDAAAAEARYGVWAGELTDFVVTEDTVLSADMQAEGDGYVLTFDLCVEGDDDAAFYYKKQMVTMGELDEEPAFTSIRLSVRIAADWTPLSVTTEETYSSKKMVTADCTGVTEVTFTYGEAAVDLSAYDSYFRAYA